MRAIEELVNEFGSDGEQVLLLIREAVGMVAYYRRVLERYELDALTGLPGRTKFHDFLVDIESRTLNVGVIFFDVNNLKTTNDTKGHQAGDLLIQKAAESILFISGEKNHVFRIGGDEFAVIVTDCTQSDIDALLSLWRERVADLNKKDDGIPCSVAAGAAYGADGYRISDVLKLADDRMYAEKHRMKENQSI